MLLLYFLISMLLVAFLYKQRMIHNSYRSTYAMGISTGIGVIAYTITTTSLLWLLQSFINSDDFDTEPSKQLFAITMLMILFIQLISFIYTCFSITADRNIVRVMRKAFSFLTFTSFISTMIVSFIFLITALMAKLLGLGNANFLEDVVLLPAPFNTYVIIWFVSSLMISAISFIFIKIYTK